MQKPNALLWLGDPQISSVTPGRRIDSYMNVVFNKFEQIVDIANSRNLQVVILGDLFDEAGDSKAILIVKLIRVLKKFKYKPICLLGNHDSLELKVTDDAAISILKEADVIQLIDKIETLTISLEDQDVLLTMIPYGHEIPKAIVGATLPPEQVVTITHADVAFEGAYPGSYVPHEIFGCSLVVNGHMHITKPVINEGVTQWFNPGNISRMTIADKDHLPAVWEWKPGIPDGGMPHYLNVASNVFDMTGLNVSPVSEGAMDVFKMDLSKIEPSEFVNRLQAELSMEMPKSERADILKEDIQATADSLQVELEVMTIIDSIYKQVLNDAIAEH